MALLLGLLMCGTGAPRSDDLCERVKEIRILPMKGEPVQDDAYNVLKANRHAVLPCLVEKLTDTTQVPDPRKAPKYAKVTVGDVALFLIVEFGDVELTQFLPDSVKGQFDAQGIYAYFDYVADVEHRKTIQKEAREWLIKRTEKKSVTSGRGR
jgi:hypothetical protein